MIHAATLVTVGVFLILLRLGILWDECTIRVGFLTTLFAGYNMEYFSLGFALFFIAVMSAVGLSMCPAPWDVACLVLAKLVLRLLCCI